MVGVNSCPGKLTNKSKEAQREVSYQKQAHKMSEGVGKDWTPQTPKHSKGRMLSQMRMDFITGPYLTRAVLSEGGFYCYSTSLKFILFNCCENGCCRLMCFYIPITYFWMHFLHLSPMSSVCNPQVKQVALFASWLTKKTFLIIR